jgi:cytochrome c oxidase assembly protein subunit 15
MSEASERRKAAYPLIRLWLWSVAFLVFVMVLLGGSTRLTDSGLSITEWQPIMGAIPPLNDADWQSVFAKYQQSSEYLLQNKGMTLAEFKIIFWWEWAHRLLGRIIGVAFAVPFLLFLVRGRLERGMILRLAALLLLGAGQGALGWYMVKSGLAGRVDVSQYRLAAHLTLAAVILVAIVWTVLSVGTRRHGLEARQEWLGLVILLLLLLQIAAGGLVAGLDAGLAYNTWPLMDGHFIPPDLFIMQPAWRNLFENALTVQFDHRMLAYLVFALMLWHAWSAFTVRAWIMLYMAVVQIVLGIWALVWHVPLALALLHQGNAIVLLMIATWSLSGLLTPREIKPVGSLAGTAPGGTASAAAPSGDV